MTTYISEHTKFMREWMNKHPQEATQQREGRALWWDKPQNQKVTQQYCAANVPTNAYYYHSGK